VVDRGPSAGSGRQILCWVAMSVGSRPEKSAGYAVKIKEGCGLRPGRAEATPLQIPDVEERRIVGGGDFAAGFACGAIERGTNLFF